jgi:hypothetical protein
MRAAALACVALALAGAGCGEKKERRTGPLTMDVAMSRAFKRAYAGAHRMVTGRADAKVVSHAGVRCRPRGPEPEAESVGWPWRCRVLWYVRDSQRPRLATYGVRVDARGCFEARSASFPRRLRERALGRTSRNPLVYVRSCP